MYVSDVLRDINHIIFVVSHLLEPLRCLLQLEDVLSELGICSVEIVIIDVISATFEFVPLSAKNNAHSRSLQFILPLHFH